MKISVIGTGYVGLVSGACFADTGNEVCCIDIDKKKIQMLEDGKIPIYEPGLEQIVKRNVAEKRLVFTTDLAAGIKHGRVIFLAVGTPPGPDGHADMQYVFKAAENIGEYINEYKVIADKSTVPIGTADRVRDIIASRTALEFDVVSNPEFLKEGAAIDDFMKPDRIVIGSSSRKAEEIMRELYAPYVRNNHPVICMDIRSAELTKYAANAMLAVRISFMNEIAGLCEKAGANIKKVRDGIGYDSRIGMSFLYAGAGYGGSCFPKDVKAVIKTADDYGLDFSILKAVENVNNTQKLLLVKKFENYWKKQINSGKSKIKSLSDLTAAVWGLSFKPNTDDMREAPAIEIIRRLQQLGIKKIAVFDPEAAAEAKKTFGTSIQYCKTDYDALKGADSLFLMTEWMEFRNPDFEKMAALMNHQVIFDGRNIYDKEKLLQNGWFYEGIGIGQSDFI
ncbi:MAG: UDP-glucose 6-dehydrogenase [Spirochaetes bacterium GWF1_41_5]|nr:MAG: UDP-glucose 6-dehydrogenase [Spirochaetes bacterium GWF1_41_5]HBE04472.1 UDP-glucose 6-dehydrogenase [Spirochaetia bacterium]